MIVNFSYICAIMKSILHKTKSLSLSFLLMGGLLFTAFQAQANDNDLPSDNDKDKIAKKADERLYAPKTKLSMDAGFTYSGMLNSEFKLSSYKPSVHFLNTSSAPAASKSTNAIFVLPNKVQLHNQLDMQRYHKVQVVLPLSLKRK